ncbi:heterotrimeric G protein alpha subunit B [Favolaschia claudopus]|uniref:Heterotrimeric G protein alpha subunit B n=1 Tax=Favolaschia claudopus TaxID=2862362 RepID=A0AAW0AZT6_9AGAR
MENLKRFQILLGDPGYTRKKEELHILAVAASRSSPNWHSLFMKHLETVDNGGYSAHWQQREVYKKIIFTNVTQAMRSVLEAIPGLDLELSPENAVLRDTILQSPTQIEAHALPQDIAAAIRDLWTADFAVKVTVRRGREFQLSNSAAYFFTSMNRISQDDYIPTNQDISHAYVEQQGIEETSLWAGHILCKIWNLPAQLERSEERKSLHYYENIEAIIFYVDLGDYDQFSYEDESGTNCLQEALTLFDFSQNDSVCNSWFVETNIILFLGIDRFMEKLEHIPLSDFFPDYQGGTRYDAACEYLLHRFVSLNQNAATTIYAAYTTMDDPGQLRCE